MANMLDLFYVNCGSRGWNFGDEYSKVIVERVSGQKVRRVEKPEEAQLIAVGSILHLTPAYFAGKIWGTGIIAEEQMFHYPYAEVKALRGKLTARRVLEIKDVPLGDPVLLLEKPNIEPKYELGILPHYVDWDIPMIWDLAKREESVLVIDPLARDAPERIASCKRILSSSLHGLIVADAFGVPNLWTLFAEGNGKISGNSFKFRDYYSVYNMNDPVPLRFDKIQNLNMLMGYVDSSYEPKELTTIRKDLLEAFPKELIA